MNSKRKLPEPAILEWCIKGMNFEARIFVYKKSSKIDINLSLNIFLFHFLNPQQHFTKFASKNVPRTFANGEYHSL